jgi:hypothetical protein
MPIRKACNLPSQPLCPNQFVSVASVLNSLTSAAASGGGDVTSALGHITSGAVSVFTTVTCALRDYFFRIRLSTSV